MSQPGNTSYAERKAAGLCPIAGCDQPPADDANECEFHRDRRRERVRRAVRKLRARWKKAKLCVRCGGKRKPGHTWCAACLIGEGRLRSTAVIRSVNTSGDRIASRTSLVTEGDGRTRRRFRGKHRGPATKEEIDAEDIKAMRALLQLLEDGLATWRGEEIQRLPRIQRDDAHDAAISHLRLLLRWAAEMLERHEPKRVRAIVAAASGGE